MSEQEKQKDKKWREFINVVSEMFQVAALFVASFFMFLIIAIIGVAIYF